jgi:hypothetical protein
MNLDPTVEVRQLRDAVTPARRGLTGDRRSAGGQGRGVCPGRHTFSRTVIRLRVLTDADLHAKPRGMRGPAHRIHAM